MIQRTNIETILDEKAKAPVVLQVVNLYEVDEEDGKYQVLELADKRCTIPAMIDRPTSRIEERDIGALLSISNWSLATVNTTGKLMLKIKEFEVEQKLSIPEYQDSECGSINPVDKPTTAPKAEDTAFLESLHHVSSTGSYDLYCGNPDFLTVNYGGKQYSQVEAALCKDTGVVYFPKAKGLLGKTPATIAKVFRYPSNGSVKLLLYSGSQFSPANVSQFKKTGEVTASEWAPIEAKIRKLVTVAPDSVEEEVVEVEERPVRRQKSTATRPPPTDKGRPTKKPKTDPALDKKLKELQQQNERYKTKLNALKETNAKLNEKLQGAISEKAKSREKLEAATAELHTMQDTLEETKTELKDTRTALHQQKKSAKQQIKALKEEAKQRVEEAIKSADDKSRTAVTYIQVPMQHGQYSAYPPPNWPPPPYYSHPFPPK